MAIHGGRRRGEVWRARIGEAEEGMKGKVWLEICSRKERGSRKGIDWQIKKRERFACQTTEEGDRADKWAQGGASD